MRAPWIAAGLLMAALAVGIAPSSATSLPAPVDSPGGAFSAQTKATAAGDYLAACALYAPSFLRPLQVLGWEPAKVQQACAEQLRDAVNGLTPARRAALLSQRVVAVRKTGTRAQVTVERTLYGAALRATGKAARERGRWLVVLPPVREHVGRGIVLDVPSASMVPTLGVGDTILVDQGASVRTAPPVGDIVVLNPPPGAERVKACGVRRRKGEACAKATPGRLHDRFLKRIVAGPGDRISIRAGRLVRNGVRVAEPYVRPCGRDGPDCELPRTITIPARRWFVMGDNRGASFDSRAFGPVPASAFVGTVRRLGP